MTNIDLDQLLEIAKEAAVKGGEEISSFDRSRLEVNSKSVGSSLASQVVTDVDILSQNAILSVLKPSCKEYNIGILAEEGNDDLSRLKRDYFWCVDPMDGTLSFINNDAGYSVSIALVDRSGTAVIGVVYNPVDNSLYYAQKGKGAFKNNKAFCSKSSGYALSVIVDRSLYNSTKFISSVDNFRKRGYEIQDVVHSGGAVMNAIWVVEKDLACYFKLPKPSDGGGCLWDFAATSVIVKESGAFCSDIYGDQLDLNSSESIFMNRKGVCYCSSQELLDIIKEEL